jgi:hypothetical protein
MKWRNSKERELLASGGSRDQTLPNKNNPNPDLSDAKCDRQSPISPPGSPLEIATQAARNQQQQQQIAQQHHQQQLSQSPISNLLASAKAIETKFQSNCLQTLKQKFDIHPQAKPGQEFKYEFDDTASIRDGQPLPPPAQQRQMFSQFFDRNENTTKFPVAGQHGGEDIKMNLYYDDYDSNSDSEEEINVT